MIRAVLFAILVPVVPMGAMGCGASAMSTGVLDDVERVREAPTAREGATQAPEVYARAEQERQYAHYAQARGDGLGATLHAERALTAYGRALAVGRLSRAIAALADAQKALDDTTADEQSLAISRAKLELEAEELDRRAQFARARLLPAASGANSDRQTARLTAAQSVVFQAVLLCGAARLASDDASGVGDAQTALDSLNARLSLAATQKRDSTPGTLIDDADTARAQCLSALTRARRGSGADDGADALLAELSAAGGWDPTRDERGVIITVRGAFSAGKLTDDGKAKFETLGRVAAAHPTFGVQVVVHDAQTPAPNDESSAERVAAVTRALVAGGASAAHLKGERAGSRAPVADPLDPRLRARNERVDVVFVSRG